MWRAALAEPLHKKIEEDDVLVAAGCVLRATGLGEELFENTILVLRPDRQPVLLI